MKSLSLLAVGMVSVVVLATLPFSNAFFFDFFPSPKDSIGFYLYPNPANSSDYDKLDYNDARSVSRSRYDRTKNVIIYASGFLQNRDTDPIIKNAYLGAMALGLHSQANVIVVDWGKLSGYGTTFPSDPNLLPFAVQAKYAEIALNVPKVGSRTAEFIQFLQKNGFLPGGAASVHLIGQSMGAHVMGIAGLQYKLTNFLKPLARITGTEPAGPLYQQMDKAGRLDASDAAFVDVVHTDEGGNGYDGPCGTVDFVVNGGKAPQPACVGSTDSYCSHNTAVFYFAKSVFSPLITATSKSDSSVKIPFGEFCPTTAKGLYDATISLP